MFPCIEQMLFVLTGLVHNGLSVKLLASIKIQFVKIFLDHTFQILPFILLSSMYYIRNTDYITIPCLIFVIINLLWCLKKLPKKYEIVNREINRFRDLSMHRGIVYMMTCICIYAIDLPKFRNGLGKTRDFGTGLMDVGIGLFVLYMGINGYGEKWNNQNNNVKKKLFKKILIISFILFLLGLIRLVLMKLTHLSYSPVEYGRDMNVFFVLSAIKFSGSMLEIFFSERIYPWKIALFIGIIYELWLRIQMYSATEIKSDYDFRINKNFIQANIESLISIIGYLALFFTGRQIGITFFNKSSKITPFKSSIYMLAISLLVLLVDKLLIFENIIYEESRRVCNLSYILWIISVFLFGLSIVRVMMNYHESEFGDELHYSEKIDRFGFLYFIIGNILVGIFRLLWNASFELPKWSSVFILYIYCSLNFFLSHNLQNLIGKFI